MQNNSQFSFTTAVVRRNRRVTIVIAALIILLGLIPIATIRPSAENREPPVLVVRIDDIQDFAFREAQLSLIMESVVNDIPVSIAVIAGMFGEDTEIVQMVKLASISGSDVTVHGWKHEDLATLSLSEQAELLYQSRIRIEEILDLKTRVLVPPMFSFSDDTVAAMYEEGFNIISTFIDLSKPGLISNVISLPATIELSDYSNGTWTMKRFDSIKAEVSSSIQKYGYAMIVTHPQEFIMDGKLDQVNIEYFRSLLQTLKEHYSFNNLENLAEKWRQ